MKYLIPVFSLAAAKNVLLQDLSKLPNYDLVKQGLLNQHNQYRSDLANGVTFKGVYGKNIHKLSWDNELAQSAQEFANQCNFYHPGGDFGENLAYRWHWADSNLVNSKEYGEHPVNQWQTETEYFTGDFNLLDPNNNIFYGNFYMNAGHYTAMMWDDITKLGCGTALCTTLKNSKDGDDYVFLQDGFQAQYTVCRYRAAGNYGRNFFTRTFNADEIAADCPIPALTENGLCTSGTSSADVNDPVQPPEPKPPLPTQAPIDPPTEAPTEPPTEAPETTPGNDIGDDLCKWYPYIEENVDYRIENARDGGVLDIPYADWNAGKIHNYCCHAHGGKNQRFQFQKNRDDCTYTITSAGWSANYAIGYGNGQVRLVREDICGLSESNPDDNVRWNLDQVDRENSIYMMLENSYNFMTLDEDYLTPNLNSWNEPENGEVQLSEDVEDSEDDGLIWKSNYGRTTTMEEVRQWKVIPW